MIKKLLIANRGEIACRIAKTAREMGVKTVGVYSSADQGSLHVRAMDEAVEIGPPEASASYLDVEKVIRAAKETGSDAIHPGYGFLSERADFAERCEQEELVFVGPSANAMRLLGAKIDAKNLAVKVGVPVTPGFFEPGATAAELKKAAAKIGYPVMLKASAGGGGRGMRIVRDSTEFDDACRLASEEAVKAFGDGAMMVEKLIERPRHIEVQLLADKHGNVACLFERECSIQRRHQKVIEEAPSPIMTPTLWKEMQDASKRLALGAGYTNAGTVEFMFDQATGESYFLEVNARLQVEHPVTEAITGLDLVQWQIRIASGEKLTLDPKLMQGDRSAISGHAIEARIISEDPSKGFLPSIGKIVGWAAPQDNAVRVDSGFSKDSEVTQYYDSLLAKLICDGSSRKQAIAMLRNSLLDFHILGVTTNVPFVLDVIDNSDFQNGEFDTGFLGREFAEWNPGQTVPDELKAILELASQRDPSELKAKRAGKPAWDAPDSWRATTV